MLVNKAWYYLQTSSDGVQSEIVGATDASYSLSFDDIGFLVSVSCEPVRSDLARGPIILSEHIGPVLPGNISYLQFLCMNISSACFRIYALRHELVFSLFDILTFLFALP